MKPKGIARASYSNVRKNNNNKGWSYCIISNSTDEGILTSEDLRKVESIAQVQFLWTAEAFDRQTSNIYFWGEIQKI